VQLLGGRFALLIEPGAAVESDAVDDESAVFVPSD